MTSRSSRILPQLLRAVGKLPLPLLRAVGGLAGRLSYIQRNRMARVTRRNIERCFPEMSPEQQRRLERASLRETGRLAAETLAVWSRPYGWLRQRIRAVHGLEMAKGQLAQGRGLIVLAPHLGNWEVLGFYLTELGPVTSLYAPPKRPELEGLVREARQASGATVVPTNRRGVASLFQALQKGHISGILPDQNPNEAGGRFSEFFEQPALTMTLPYKLVQRTGCRAIFGYAKRVTGGWEIIFQEPTTDFYSDNEKLALHALNQGVEACVSGALAQYQWEYKRFKRQPNATNFYSGMS